MIKIDISHSHFKNEDKKKQIKLKGFIYQLEIYNTKITLIFGNKNIKKYNKLFDHSGAEAFLCDYLETNSEIIIFFKDNPKMKTITHECVHASNFILNWIGYKYTKKGDEIDAYLTGHLVDVVMKAKKKYQSGNGFKKRNKA